MVTLACFRVVVRIILYGPFPGFIEVSQYFEPSSFNCARLQLQQVYHSYASLRLALLHLGHQRTLQQNSIAKIRIQRCCSAFFFSVFPSSATACGFLVNHHDCGHRLSLSSAKKLPVRIPQSRREEHYIRHLHRLFVITLLLAYPRKRQPPMNQTLRQRFRTRLYLNRELSMASVRSSTGQTHQSSVVYKIDASGQASPMYKEGKPSLCKVVKTSNRPARPLRNHLVQERLCDARRAQHAFPAYLQRQHAAAYSD